MSRHRREPSCVDAFVGGGSRPPRGALCPPAPCSRQQQPPAAARTAVRVDVWPTRRAAAVPALLKAAIPRAAICCGHSDDGSCRGGREQRWANCLARGAELLSPQRSHFRRRDAPQRRRSSTSSFRTRAPPRGARSAPPARAARAAGQFVQQATKRWIRNVLRVQGTSSQAEHFVFLNCLFFRPCWGWTVAKLPLSCSTRNTAGRITPAWQLPAAALPCCCTRVMSFLHAVFIINY